jgi:hypothetical protein
MFHGGTGGGIVDTTDRFQFQGLSGRVLFRAGFSSPVVGGLIWGIRSVTLNGMDITDTPIDLSSLGDVNGLEIVVSDTATTISGAVMNGSGLP